MPARLFAIFLVAALVLAACSSGDSEGTSTTSTVAAPTTSVTENPTTAPSPSTTSTTPPRVTTTAEAPDEASEIVVLDGEPVGGPITIAVAIGSDVHIRVVSNQPEQVHVHGYDLFYDVTPEESAEIMFVADVPGIFEIELEGSHTLIAELEVS